MISAVVAALAGFLLYHGSGDDYAGNPLAERHLWAGMAFAVAAIATWIASLWTDAMGANPVWYRLMLFATFGIMAFAGHDGASMTHGRDYLTQYAPTWLHGMLGDEKKSLVQEVVKLADPVVYTEIIAPIFERRCVACHNAEKSKGKYRMDTYELLLAGGKEGPGMRLGSAAESLLIQRIELPLDDEEHMPPEGKPQVTAAELRVLRWWIDQGADPAKKLSQSNATAEIDAALKEIAGQKEPVAPAYDE
jgi:mono/diheme cytochrome c family protein